MRRRRTGSIVLVLSIALVSLMSSDSTIQAQPPERFFVVADTGVIPLGPNQVLRMNVLNVALGDGSVRFRRISYTQDACTPEGVCKLNGTGFNNTGALMLMTGEAASIIVGTDGGIWRVVALSTTRNVQVNASIIDTVTGQVDAILVGLLVP